MSEQEDWEIPTEVAAECWEAGASMQKSFEASPLLNAEGKEKLKEEIRKTIEMFGSHAPVRLSHWIDYLNGV